MSVLEIYGMLLKASDSMLIILVNQYNCGLLDRNTRFALEIIDGCVGDGDRVAS